MFRILELTAMLTMLTDHIGIVFYPDHVFLRVIGRVAFPLYAYALARGYLHTRNLKAYFKRLLILAALSQVPYTLALDTYGPNVIFTFVVCLGVLYSLDHFPRPWAFSILFIASLILQIFDFSYGMYGLFLVLCYRYLKELYLFFSHFLLNLIFMPLLGWIQMFSLVPTFFFMLKGVLPGMNLRVNRTFYRLFYPAHLLVLFLLHEWMD